MSTRKFKFVSPGVFLREIDNSQIPAVSPGIGPLIIGRFRRGPAMKPTRVESLSEFQEIFGESIPGGETEDVWRSGNGLLAAAYAPYAVEAYFKAGGAEIGSPVTVVRLLGVGNDGATDEGEPGWVGYDPYGLFATPQDAGDGVVHSTAFTASLLGVVYAKSTGVGLKLGFAGKTHTSQSVTVAAAPENAVAAFVDSPTSDGVYQLVLKSTSGTETKNISFDVASTDNYIRKNLNTNPVKTNDKISTATGLDGDYFLGETFEEKYQELVRKHGRDNLFVAAVKLNANMGDFKSSQHGLEPAKSGWVIPQHFGAKEDFNPTGAEKLFRFVSLQDGEQGNCYIVKIVNIRISESDLDPYGKFDVIVCKVTSEGEEIVENYPNCNLNPNSENFISNQIGDQFFVYNTTEKRNRVYGSFPNISKTIRVEMANEVGESGPTRKSSIPFGYLGPVVPNDIEVQLSSGKGTASSWASQTIQFGSSSANKVKLRWPGPQLITTGSLLPGTNDKYYFGVTPYTVEKNGIVGTTQTNIIDKGFQEYHRGLSSFSTHLADQKAGVASGNTRHSYVFSLDDIVLSASVVGEAGGVLNGVDMEGVPVRAVHVPGSHKGIGQQAMSTAVAASASILFNSASVGGITIELDDGTNPKVSFLFVTASTQLGIIDLVGQDAAVRIPHENEAKFGMSVMVSSSTGGPDPDTGGGVLLNATNFRTAVNACDGLNGRPLLNINAAAPVTSHNPGPATSLAKKVMLTQTVAGSSGNTSITIETVSAGGYGANSVANAIIGSASFAGGRDATSVSLAVNAYTNQFSASVLVRDVVGGFSMPMAGGMDGVDITEADPFNNSSRTLSGKTAKTSYAYNSIDTALEIVKDSEIIEYNLIAMPGITNKDLTKKLVENSEARGDALAIVDLPDVYIPPHEVKKSSFQGRVTVTTPSKSARNLEKRQLNSSYGAAYYPWVKIGDRGSRLVWVPPSVVALGVMAHTELKEDVWFAPAGFNRGGLNRTTSGLNVLGVSESLLAKDRDILYDANINPIASFVTEGIVIFGQKTLQQTPSALDRINVRRLLIFVKRLVSRISNNLIFDQNLPATWNRFKSQVIPELESIKTGLGLSDFKVLLDETTTTPDLVDRNIMYAKIFLKPARAIEFIAVDFVITNTGASFDD